MQEVMRKESISVATGNVKLLAHFTIGGWPAVRLGYSCSSDTSR